MCTFHVLGISDTMVPSCSCWEALQHSSVGNNSASADRGGMISMFTLSEGWNAAGLTLPILSGDTGGLRLMKDAGAGAGAGAEVECAAET